MQMVCQTFQGCLHKAFNATQVITCMSLTKQACFCRTLLLNGNALAVTELEQARDYLAGSDSGREWGVRTGPKGLSPRERAGHRLADVQTGQTG